MIKIFLFIFFLTVITFMSLGIRSEVILSGVVATFSILLLTHSIFTLLWMLYAWDNPKNAKKHKSPEIFQKPYYTFTILIPARHEESVIESTIGTLASIDYPRELYEVLILVRQDDVSTKLYAESALMWEKDSNIRVVNFWGYPINKPHALNVGLSKAKNEIVVVFDAEDDPHKDILNVANTVLLQENPDIIQSGVQLMNYDSRWFSLLNVLEYFFWFKSGLLFFSKVGGTTPLGGNTVFFKTRMLKKAGGWKEDCLTEDAEIGLRLSFGGAKVKVIYDAIHSTREETPATISDFIKQRTRWNLGFLQVLSYGDWLKVIGLRKKVFTFYILFSPFLQTLILLSLPIFILIALNPNLPFLVSFFAFFPLYIFLLQLITWIFGSYEFTKSYEIKYPYSFPFRILATFFFYQSLLTLASTKALIRFYSNNFTWDKTHHENSHRVAWTAKKLMYKFS